MTNSFLTGKRLVRFEAIQNVLVPRAQGFNQSQRDQSRFLINHLLKTRPSSQLFQLHVFLLVIDLVSFLLFFRIFQKLSNIQSQRILNWLFDNPIPLVRKGFWGLNALAKMGVYGQSSVYEEIGYQLKRTPS